MMQAMRNTILMLVLVVVSGCGGDGGSGGQLDAASSGDASPGSDGASSLDGATGADATMRDGATGLDGTTGLDGATGADAATVVGTLAVQCRRNVDCLTANPQCSISAPGGICTGCALNGNDCPTDTSCSQFGSCIRDCTTDAQCNRGMRCDSQGRCAIRSCSVASPCPAPYTCVGSLCQRPTCPGAGACPSPLTCDTVTSTCVEP